MAKNIYVLHSMPSKVSGHIPGTILNGIAITFYQDSIFKFGIIEKVALRAIDFLGLYTHTGRERERERT